MSSTAWILAIDFGTSFTVAAARRGDGPPEVIEIDGERRIPSVVMIAEGGAVVVGRAADEMAAALPTQVLRSPKSRLGDPAPVVLAGKAYQAASLVAEVLAKVLEEAIRHAGSAPAETRLTYPATWSGQRQQQLLRAAELAGLPRPSLVTEPIAAAISYSEATDLQSGSNILVYDLGGGTFDCAVLRSTADGFQIVGRPCGDRQLGGELFDELLANAIGERLPPQVWENLQLGETNTWRQAWIGLRREAQRAKELLSTRPTAEILIGLPDGIHEVRVTRVDLETHIGPYIADSVQIAKDAVADSGLHPADLTAIFIVGGSSRMPIVETLMGSAFPGVPISKRGDPKSVVALGATHPHAGATQRTPVTNGGQETDPSPLHGIPTEAVRVIATSPLEAVSAARHLPPTRTAGMASAVPAPLITAVPRKRSRRTLAAVGVALLVTVILGGFSLFRAAGDDNSDDETTPTVSLPPGASVPKTADSVPTTDSIATPVETDVVTSTTSSSTTTSPSTTTIPLPTESVMALMRADPELQRFVDIIDFIGLTPTLDSATGVTIFAPTDAAFDAYLLEHGGTFPADIPALINHHIVDAAIDPLVGGIFTTRAGDQIEVSRGTVEDVEFGDVVMTGTNGTVFRITRVLVNDPLPGEITSTTAATSSSTTSTRATTSPTAAPTTAAPTTAAPTTAVPTTTQPTTPPPTTSNLLPVPNVVGDDYSTGATKINQAGFTPVKVIDTSCADPSSKITGYTPQSPQPRGTPIYLTVC